MVFNSLQYAVFLPLVLLAYWRLGRRRQNALLLGASYLFYALWDWRFLPLMLLSTATDFTVGLWLERTADDRRRKRIFMLSLAVNLGVLAFFKYFELLHRLGRRLPGRHRHRRRVAQLADPAARRHQLLHVPRDLLHVRRVPSGRSGRATRPLDFALFVAFFPQLVAGPIERAQLLLPQFQHDRLRPDVDEGPDAACR